MSVEGRQVSVAAKHLAHTVDMQQSRCHSAVFEIPYSDGPSVGEEQVLAICRHVEFL